MRKPTVYNTLWILPRFLAPVSYRRGHFTETVFLKASSDVANAIIIASKGLRVHRCSVDSDQLAHMLLLDMLSTFDTVDHNIFIQRLSQSFGIKVRAFSWLESYVKGLAQSVHLSGDETLSIQVTCGVPQGSVLGLPPLRTIIRLIWKESKTHMASSTTATQVISSFTEPSQTTELKPWVLRLYIERISEWMASNRLKLNPSKSECIWCTTLRLRRLLDDSTSRLCWF